MQQESAGLYRFYTHKPGATIGIMLGGCILALMYNVVLMQAVRTFSSVGTAVLGNFRTVMLITASAVLLGELKDWGATRYIGCVNTFVGAAAYGLHPKIFGTPVSRALPRSIIEEIKDVRKLAVAEGVAADEERDGLATPKGAAEEEEDAP